MWCRHWQSAGDFLPAGEFFIPSSSTLPQVLGVMELYFSCSASRSTLLSSTSLSNLLLCRSYGCQLHHFPCHCIR
eukprot:3965618-Amphidinium_carterae.1